MTIRDHVWDEVLNRLVKTGEFRISDLDFNESQRHTVRRVLKEMEDLGWLWRENEHAATWKLGDLAALHLNISPDKIRSARD